MHEDCRNVPKICQSIQFLPFGHQPSHDALPERVLCDNKDDHDSCSQQQTLTLVSSSQQQTLTLVSADIVGVI